MKYLVIEIQTSADGSVANLVTAYDDRNLAESAFHSILASAAVSNLPIHSAVIITNEGFVINRECYKHEVQVVETSNDVVVEPEVEQAQTEGGEE